MSVTIVKKNGVIKQSSALPDPVPVFNILHATDFYSNHSGTVDNVLTTTVSGVGTANTNAANHRMDLSTGIGAQGEALYKLDLPFDLGFGYFSINFKIQNIVNGAGGIRKIQLGVGTEPFPTTDGAFIYNTEDPLGPGVWICRTKAGIWEETELPPLSNGDIVSILAKSHVVEYYVNGSLVATHASNDISGLNLIPFAFVGGYLSYPLYNTYPMQAREISIDMISFKRYLL